jgi:hypothetical protein
MIELSQGWLRRQTEEVRREISEWPNELRASLKLGVEITHHLASESQEIDTLLNSPPIGRICRSY